MSIPILATKLYIPPTRTGVVPRTRLFERLNEGLAKGRKLTLISAPAGFGKTTLASEWVATCGTPVAWLSLDEGDNDPVRFLAYLVSALQTQLPKMGVGVLAALQTPQPPPIELILTTLLNEIAAIPGNIALVLDDYHAIEAKPVDQALLFLMDHLPPQLHLVIATREDPHFPLARLRARGQLIELRAADLRFTPSEATQFLNQMMGLRLSERDIAALDRRTEGWIAGLQLAAIALQSQPGSQATDSIQGNPDAGSFIKSFTGSHRFVLDYLLEEVLHSQPAAVQTFLLRTSILDRLCGPLCDAVCSAGTGLPDSAASEQETAGQTTLEYLEHANLFLVSLDNERRWYRYHHLFADLLRQRLSQQTRASRSGSLSGEMGKGGAADYPDVFVLHRRASAWYERNGQAADAIHHALAAQDFERAATLIELAVPEIRRNRQDTTLMELSWLKALPAELIRLRPVLSVAYAYALFGSGELETVEDWLQDAERWLGSPADSAGMVVVDEKEFRRLPGMIALLRTALALARGDMSETVKNARRVLDLAPKDDHLMLGGAASTLGLAAWAGGDLTTARQMIQDGMAHMRHAGYISPAIGDAITLADIQLAQGCLREAESTYQLALQWATSPGAPTLRGAADMYVGLSGLCYEHNDLLAALQHLFTSQSLGELAGLPQNPYRWRAAMARIRAAQGDFNTALDFLEQAESLYNANFSPNVRPLAARKARLWLVQGRLDEALGWVRAQGLSVENELSYLREYDHLTLVRVLLACHPRNPAGHNFQEAVRLLERLRKAAQAGGRNGSLIEILILLALAKYTQGDLPAAFDSLRQAVTLAEPQGYVRIFLDEGPHMLRLLREAVMHEIMPDYAGNLLFAYSLEQPEGQTVGQPFARPELLPGKTILVEPLSQRELEVLKLIAQGLSNRQIGERLFLALDTVKGHNRIIFDKLQVQNRTEAVARARELGLL